TEKLSDVFMDRFDLIYMGYPENVEIEENIVAAKAEKLEAVQFPKDLLELMLDFVRTLRLSKDLERKPSVRASLGLYERAQSIAYLMKRKQVTFKDIESSLISVLSHRIRLKPSVKYLKDPSEFIKEQFEEFIQSNQQYRNYQTEKESGEGDLG
ncbi:hypothetical protein KY311_00665, partial [Candidatus Woesearchaeota archaeon]|nr:hypothetical protein [Candidatus Woesearchaeota archaeon]